MAKRARRGGLLLTMAAPALLMTTALACNALIGNDERRLEDPDGPLDGSRVDTSALPDEGAVDTATPPSDGATPDAAPIVFDVKGPWTSPNGAVFSVTDAGVRITNDGPDSGGHPIVLANPPALTSDDYTVEALVLVPADHEFGILARVQADKSAVLFGSEYGSTMKSFLGRMPSADWNPVSLASSLDTYTLETGVRYRMRLLVRGTDARAKMWKSTLAEPNDFQVFSKAPFAAGRGVGFYVYAGYEAVLERVTVSIP